MDVFDKLASNKGDVFDRLSSGEKAAGDVFDRLSQQTNQKTLKSFDKGVDTSPQDDIVGGMNINQIYPQYEPEPGRVEPQNKGFSLSDIKQSVTEIPQNLKIGTVGLGASILESIKKRGMQLSGAGIFPDEAVRRQFEAVPVDKTPKSEPTQPQGIIGREIAGDKRFEMKTPQEVNGLPLPGALTAEAVGAVTRMPDVGAKIIREKQQTMQEALPADAGPATRLARLVHQNTPSMAASVVASLLTGDPVVGLALLGETEGGSSFQRQLDTGASVGKAAIVSDLSEAAEIGGEMLVFPKLIKGFKGAIPLQDAFRVVLENAGQEGATGFVQQFLDTVSTDTTKGVALKDAVQNGFIEGLKAIPENALVGGVTAGMIETVSQGPGGVKKTYKEVKEAINASYPDAPQGSSAGTLTPNQIAALDQAQRVRENAPTPVAKAGGKALAGDVNQTLRRIEETRPLQPGQRQAGDILEGLNRIQTTPPVAPAPVPLLGDLNDAGRQEQPVPLLGDLNDPVQAARSRKEQGQNLKYSQEAFDAAIARLAQRDAATDENGNPVEATQNQTETQSKGPQNEPVTQEMRPQEGRQGEVIPTEKTGPTETSAGKEIGPTEDTMKSAPNGQSASTVGQETGVSSTEGTPVVTPKPYTKGTDITESDIIEEAHQKYIDIQKENIRQSVEIHNKQVSDTSENPDFRKKQTESDYNAPKIPTTLGIQQAVDYVSKAWPAVLRKSGSKKALVEALKTGDFVLGAGEFDVQYNAGQKTPSGVGKRPIRYDKWSVQDIDAWAAKKELPDVQRAVQAHLNMYDITPKTTASEPLQQQGAVGEQAAPDFAEFRKRAGIPENWTITDVTDGFIAESPVESMGKKQGKMVRTYSRDGKLLKEFGVESVVMKPDFSSPSSEAAAKPEAAPVTSEIDKEKLQRTKQMLEDLIANAKSDGRKPNQAWLDRLTQVTDQLEGTTDNSEFIASNQVFGHPLATGSSEYQALIPIKVRKGTDISSFISKAQKMLDALQTKIAKQEAIVKGRVKATPSQIKEAKKYVKSMQQTEDETFRDLLRQETLPELYRLEKAKIEKFGTNFSSPSSEAAAKPEAAPDIPMGYIPIYRGAGKRGFKDLKVTEGGVYGNGIYFYTDPMKAKSHATSGGGVIVGLVKPEDAFIKEGVVVIKDVSKVIIKDKIPVNETTLTGKDWINRANSSLKPFSSPSSEAGPAQVGSALKGENIPEADLTAGMLEKRIKNAIEEDFEENKDRYKDLTPEQAEKVKERIRNLWTSNRDRVVEMVKNKDVKLLEILHTGNPFSRKVFTVLTGIKLPNTEGKTKEVVGEFVGKEKVAAMQAEKDAAKPVKPEPLTKDQAKAKMVQARQDKFLDGKIRYRGNVMTRREYVEKLHAEGRKPYEKTVKQDAPKSVQDEYKYYRKEYGSFGNPNHPGYKKYLELKKQVEGGVEKTEYRADSLTDNTMAVLTKTEYDYFKSLAETKAEKPEATEKAPEAEPKKSAVEHLRDMDEEKKTEKDYLEVKWNKLKAGEHVILSDKDVDQLLSIYSNTDEISRLVTINNPKRIGTLDRYDAWLGSPLEESPTAKEDAAGQSLLDFVNKVDVDGNKVLWGDEILHEYRPGYYPNNNDLEILHSVLKQRVKAGAAEKADKTGDLFAEKSKKEPEINTYDENIRAIEKEARKVGILTAENEDKYRKLAIGAAKLDGNTTVSLENVAEAISWLKGDSWVQDDWDRKGTPKERKTSGPGSPIYERGAAVYKSAGLPVPETKPIKQAWEMTQKEWFALSETQMDEFLKPTGKVPDDLETEGYSSTGSKKLFYSPSTKESFTQRGTSGTSGAWYSSSPILRNIGHETLVKEARDAGKPVPAEVLAEYGLEVAPAKTETTKTKEESKSKEELYQEGVQEADALTGDKHGFTEVATGINKILLSLGRGWQKAVDITKYWHNELVGYHNNPNTTVDKIIANMDAGLAGIKDTIERDYRFKEENRGVTWAFRNKIEEARGLKNSKSGDESFDRKVEALIDTEIKRKYPDVRRNTKRYKELHDSVLSKAQKILAEENKDKVDRLSSEIVSRLKKDIKDTEETRDMLGFYDTKVKDVLVLHPESERAKIAAGVVGSKKQYLDKKIVSLNALVEEFSKPSNVVVSPNTLITADMKDAAVARQKAKAAKAPRRGKSGGMVTVFTPEDIKDAVIILGYYAERGIRTSAAFTQKALEVYGERIRKHLPDIWNTLRSEGKVSGEYNPDDSTPPVPPTPTPQPPKEEASTMVPPVNEPPAASESSSASEQPNLRVRGVAQSIEDDSLTLGIISEPGEYGSLPTYTVKNMKKAQDAVAEMDAKDPERVMRIAMGSEAAPEGTDQPTSADFFTFVRARAELAGDGATLQTLLKSTVVTEEATKAGQFSKSLDTGINQEGSAYNALGRIEDANTEAVERHTGRRTTEQLKAELNQKEELIRKLEIDKLILEARVQDTGAGPGGRGPSKAGRSKGFGESNRLITKDRHEQNRAKLKNIFSSQVNTGLDPRILEIAIEEGLYYLEGLTRQGVNTFAVWSEKMKADYGDKIVPYLKDAYTASVERMKEDSLKEIKAGIAKGDIIYKTGERIQDLARIFVGEGIRSHQALTEAVHAEMVKIVPKFTLRDTFDALSGYGKWRAASKNEVDVEIRRLKGEILQLSKLEAIKAKEALKATGSESVPPSDEKRRLIREVNEAKRKGGYDTGNAANRLKSALATRETRLRNRIRDLKKEIVTRQKMVKTRTAPPTNTTIEELQAEVDALVKEHTAIFGKPGLTDAQKLAMSIKAAQRSITTLEERIASGNTAPLNTPSTVVETPELKALRSKRDGLQKQLDSMRKAAKPQKTQAEKDAASIKADINRTEKAIGVIAGKIMQGDVKPTVVDKAKKPSTPELNALKNKLEQLQERYKEIRAVSVRTEAAEAAVQRSWDEIERKIREGDIFTKGKGTPLSSQKLNSLKAQRDTRKLELDRLREASPEYQQQRAEKLDEQYKQSLIKRLAQFEAQQDAGIYGQEKSKRVRQLDAEADAVRNILKTRKDLAKDKFFTTPEQADKVANLAKEMADLKAKATDGVNFDTLEDRMAYGRAAIAFRNYVNTLINAAKQKTVSERLKHPVDTISEGLHGVFGVTKSILSTLDNSAIGTQGITTALVDIADTVLHPTKPSYQWLEIATQSFVDIWNTFGGQKVMDEIDADIVSRPNYLNGLYKKHKVAVMVMEENYPVHLYSRIKWVGKPFEASEVAFTGFQRRNRADTFDKLVDLAESADLDIMGDDIKGLGKLANSLTARGQLEAGKIDLEPASDLINLILFSGRLLKSDIDLLTGNQLNMDMSSFARKQGAIKSLKAIAVMAGILILSELLRPGSVEWDKTKTTFGGIRIGGIVYQPFKRFTNLVVLASRLITGTYTSSTGNVTKLNTGVKGQPTRETVLDDFFKNKYSPPLSILRNILRGRDFEGKPPTVVGTVVGSTTPLPAQTAKQYIQNPKVSVADRIVAMLAETMGLRTSPVEYAPSTENQKLRDLQNEYAKRVYKKPFEDLNPDQQATINKIPSVAEQNRIKKAAYADKAYTFTQPQDEFDAGKRILSSLPDYIQKKLSDNGIDSVGIERTITVSGEDFYLNDKRFKAYENMLQAEIKAFLPQLSEKNSEKAIRGLLNDKKESVRKRLIREIKEGRL